MSIQHIDLAKKEREYSTVRSFSEKLVLPLHKEDFIIQSMEDVSPPKWHLAHTTWFFEKFILKECVPHYKAFNEQFDYLFNSYYETVGPFHPRIQRGLITRPTVDEVLDYRQHVDSHMKEFLTSSVREEKKQKVMSLLDIGIHHEQQHQELLLTDIKFNLSNNPFLPAYQSSLDQKESQASNGSRFINVEGGLINIGYGGASFSFDNERPVHKVWLEPYRLASHLVTNEEYLEFMEDGGYEKPEYWLSDGWYAVKQNNWSSPLYWFQQDEEWCMYTLSGVKAVNLAEPVCHVSFYEADAYARWAGKRLPTEQEWEHAASTPIQGNFAEAEVFHPSSAEWDENSSFYQMYGDVWEWTKSPYVSYPGNQPYEGALGEYNAKFMCNQMVLRGGSCATSSSHIRSTYRNFFQPDKRWQFSGIRLAEDGHSS